MAEFNREPHMRLEMLSQPRFLAGARAMVQQVTQRLGFIESIAAQISLAVDEALCNIINHGYQRRDDGRIWVNLWALEGATPGVKIVIEDRARQVDPATIQPRNLDDIRPGGLGVHIIREVMDEVRYEPREGGGMRLTMTKRQRADAAQESARRQQREGCGAGACPAPAAPETTARQRQERRR